MRKGGKGGEEGGGGGALADRGRRVCCAVAVTEHGRRYGIDISIAKKIFKKLFLLALNVVFFILYLERKFEEFTVRISGSPSNWTIPEMEKRGERVRQDRRERGFPSRNGGGFRRELR